jgi:hypothetical protein
MPKNKILRILLGGIMSFVLIFSYGFPQNFVKADTVTYDFGDAPDGGFTFYGSAGAQYGIFPSKLASDGARVSTTSDVWLGQNVNKEADSRQVDGDQFDDGIGTELHAQATSKAYVFVHVKEPGETTGTAYINMFFDWNKDGKWDGSDGAANEWAVRNFPVDLGVQTRDVAVYIPEFTAGKKIKDIWYRAILTKDQRLTYASQNGQGSWESGEIEDYGPKIRSGKRYGVVCKPDLKVIEHGKSGKLRIRKKYANSPAISQVLFANSVAPRNQNNMRSNNKTRDIRIRGVNANGAVVIYKSKKKDPPKRVVFDSFSVRVRYAKKEASVTTKCNVAVVHDKLKGRRQNLKDFTRPEVTGSFKITKQGMLSILSATIRPNSEALSWGILGFDIPFAQQHPNLPEPTAIDLNFDGQGWYNDWQCQVVPTVIKDFAGQGGYSKRCWGSDSFSSFISLYMYFDNLSGGLLSLYLRLLDANGNVIGAVDLPEGE